MVYTLIRRKAMDKKTRLSKNDIDWIAYIYFNGLATQAELANAWKVAQSTISKKLSRYGCK